MPDDHGDEMQTTPSATEAGAGVVATSPDRLGNPVPVQIKDQLWSAIRPLMQSLPGQ